MTGDDVLGSLPPPRKKDEISTFVGLCTVAGVELPVEGAEEVDGVGAGAGAFDAADVTTDFTVDDMLV